jgi:lipopolysaccharide transport system permease protein
MQRFSIAPGEMFAGLWRYRELVAAMVERDIVGRYQGSLMGLAWSFFNPVFMLLVYTFVFSVVFNARWGQAPDESRTDFAIMLFVGIIVHGVFAECVNRAPGLILANASYVKKVVFPLEILPWVALGSALFHALASVVVLLLVQLVARHQLPWTAVLFPVVLLPLMFATMGFAWFLTALGVYVRDIGQMTVLFTTVLMFLSPVFYPASALPAQFQKWLWLNPLAPIIEDGRNTLILGKLPDPAGWTIALAMSLAIAWAGFAWFQKSRRGFADVI